MVERIQEVSPRSLARMAGAFYVLTGATYVLGPMFVLAKLVVHGDAAATATRIVAHGPLLRWGFAAGLISVACSIALTLFFYDLFKPVNRSLSLLAAFFHLLGLAIAAFSSALQLAPSDVLGGAQYLSAFKVEQLQAVAYLSLQLSAQAYDAFLVFFGFYCILIGYLIFRSTFMPRILGVLLGIAGLGWMIFLHPPLAHYLFLPYITGASALGEIPLLLWLLVMGVNDQRWQEQASAAGVQI